MTTTSVLNTTMTSSVSATSTTTSNTKDSREISNENKENKNDSKESHLVKMDLKEESNSEATSGKDVKVMYVQTLFLYILNNIYIFFRMLFLTQFSNLDFIRWSTFI